MNPEEIVLAFVDCINRHDVNGLCNLMTDDHLFIDSAGAKVQGREEMRKAWVGYFYMIPDYAIEVKAAMQKDSVVGLFGTTRGTYAAGKPLQDRNRWELPASWRAVVRDGKIAEWQVYADNEPVRRIIAGQP